MRRGTLEKLCALSVDLDEVHHYHAIHGMPVPTAPTHVVYERGLPRFIEFAREQAVPITFFAVGADMLRERNGSLLRQAREAGHEIGNHTLDHLYAFSRLPEGALREQILGGKSALAEAVQIEPTGFRAPGYVMTDLAYRVLANAGVRYSSSVLPCPAYYGAKLAALSAQRLVGRRSHSVIDHPAVLLAPRNAYRVGRPYWRRGEGLVELPIGVTRRLRLPLIGTAFNLLGPARAEWLVTGGLGSPLLNLEFHGIDLLDESDGLSALAGVQPDVRIALSRKRETLRRVVARVKAAGYRFVRLDEAARALG